MISKLSPLLWPLAFFCSLFFINDWQLGLFAGAVILISVWAIAMISGTLARGWMVPKSWCLGVMAAFWLLVFLSVIGSDILNVSLMAFCFFSVLPITFLVFSTIGTDEYFKFVTKILIGIFVVLSIWALIQFFVFNEYFEGRATHPLKNPNSLAAVFSLAFVCGLGALLNAHEKKQQILLSAFCCLVFAAFVAAGSRGAFFALLPALALFLFFARDQVKANWRILGAITIFAALCFVLFDLYGNEKTNLAGRVAGTLAGTVDRGDISNNRFNLWLASWGIIKEHGFLGTGIGTFFLYFPEFRLPQDRFGTFYAHNDPLQFWVELGVLGPVLFYSFIIAVIVRTIQAVKKAQNANQKLLILTPFFALGACVIHTHVTFNFYNLSILFFVGFLLSVWFVATQKVLQTKCWMVKLSEKYSSSARIAMIAMPFIFIVGLFSAYVLSEHYTNKARDHLLAGELEEFANDVLMANKISMRGNYRSYLLAVNVPMTLLQEQSNNLTRDQKKEIYNQAISYLRQVQFINPRSASAHFYLGKIQTLVPADFIAEDMRSPQEYYERSLTLDPLHIGSRIALSYIYERELLSRERALEVIEAGLDLRYNTAKALDLYGRAAELYMKQGDSEGRDKALEKMQNFQRYLDRAVQREKAPLLGGFSTEESTL